MTGLPRTASAVKKSLETRKEPAQRTVTETVVARPCGGAGGEVEGREEDYLGLHREDLAEEDTRDGSTSWVLGRLVGTVTAWVTD